MRYPLFFLIATLFLLAPSCQKEFLDRVPETSIGKENFFNTEEDLNLYINNLYNFPGTSIFIADAATDNVTTTGNTELKTIMTTAANSSTIQGGWNWDRLRTINFFLDNFSKAEITQDQLDHFEGLARFFRARFYMGMVSRYSDVPWYDHSLSTGDEEDLFKTQDPRDYVVDRILEDYQFAVDHVFADQPTGAVNKDVVLAYFARDALYEGTYRKYHPELGLESSAPELLQIARDAARQLMDSGHYAVYSSGNTASDYYSLFTSQDLTSNPEIILANISEFGLKNNGGSTDMFGNYETSPAKDLVQSYLNADGSFYSSRPAYETALFVKEFEDRDPRLAQTYAAPGWELVRAETYTQGAGIYVQQLQKNFSGYHQIKGFVNNPQQDVYQGVDIPVLRYAEVLLIYAEARAELGELTQADLDETVNVLRARVGMPSMMMNPPVDPVQQARYPNVSDPNLLEIRRERRVELAMEGYRFADLMRWASGKLLEKEPEGLYFPSLGKYDLNGEGYNDISFSLRSTSLRCCRAFP